VAFLVHTGCAVNPDPRWRPLDVAMRSSLGGWITMTARSGREVEGELISVEPDLIRVLAVHDWYPVRYAVPPSGPPALVAIPRTDIARARLFEYQHQSFLLWGLNGLAQSVFQLFLTVPIWLAVTGAVESNESSYVVVEYPERSLDDMAAWARFPQRMPPGLDPQALLPRARQP
jgi:hypothetical protein